MKTGRPNFATPTSPHERRKSVANFVSLKQLRRRRGSEQVAAVCYRIGKRELEFLLVRTRNRRWTFPKGSIESGLTPAQAAALEAYEEAGVHGRIEEAAFARYIRLKNGRSHRWSDVEVVINAHLCEVTRRESPEEANRNPTWFSAAKAKRRLRQQRPADYGEDLARIIDRAVARIQRQYRAAHGSIQPARRAEIIQIDAARVTAANLKTTPTRKRLRQDSR